MYCQEFRCEPMLEPFCEDPNDPFFWDKSKEFQRAYEEWTIDQAEFYELFDKD